MNPDFPDNPWLSAAPDPWAVMGFVVDDPIPASALGRIDRIDFLAAIRQNRRNTGFLVIGMLALAGGFGYMIGWIWDVAMGGMLQATLHGQLRLQQLLTTPSPLGLRIAWALVCAMVVWSCVTFWRADRMVLRMTGAQETDAKALPQLHNIIEEMALAAGLPKPQVVLVPTETPNAFATGLRSDKAIIGVTSGLLQHLSRRELQGVIAHEMGHVLNGDMRYATLLAVMTGVLVFTAQIVLNARHFFGYRPVLHNRGEGRRQGNPLMLIFIVVFAVIAAILVPLLAKMIQMAVSRQREYLADATAVQLTRDPGSLIHALEKIAALQIPSINLPQRLEPLYIIPPAIMLQNGNMGWFSTHPSLQKRIERLKALE